MTKKTAADKEAAGQNLEKTFQELTEITERLESGNLDLETSLVKFERGLELASALKRRLAEIENRIETIKIKYKDTLEDDSKPEKD